MKMANGMNRNSSTAPLLLGTAMLFLILFRRVFLNLEHFRYAPPYAMDYSSGDYIIYNGVRYIPERFLILALVMQVLTFAVPAMLYMKIFKGEGYVKQLNLTLPSLKHIPIVFYGLGAVISGTALLSSLIYFLGGPLEIRAAAIDSGGNPVYDISVVAVFVLLPAVLEEFFFRSVMVGEYSRYGAVCACMISSAAFAMIRFSLALFPIYFFAGVILYIIVKATDSILFAVIVHAGGEFFNIYAWNRLSTVLIFEQNRFIFSFLATVIFVLFMIALLHSVEKTYYYKAYSDAPISLAGDNTAAKLSAVRVLSPALFVVAVIYFMDIILT